MGGVSRKILLENKFENLLYVILEKFVNFKVQLHAFLASESEGGEGSAPHLCQFSSRERRKTDTP
jgi:hypothetical protein